MQKLNRREKALEKMCRVVQSNSHFIYEANYREFRGHANVERNRIVGQGDALFVHVAVRVGVKFLRFFDDHSNLRERLRIMSDPKEQRKYFLERSRDFVSDMSSELLTDRNVEYEDAKMITVAAEEAMKSVGELIGRGQLNNPRLDDDLTTEDLKGLYGGLTGYFLAVASMGGPSASSQDFRRIREAVESVYGSSFWEAYEMSGQDARWALVNEIKWVSGHLSPELEQLFAKIAVDSVGRALRRNTATGCFGVILLAVASLVSAGLAVVHAYPLI